MDCKTSASVSDLVVETLGFGHCQLTSAVGSFAFWLEELKEWLLPVISNSQRVRKATSFMRVLLSGSTNWRQWYAVSYLALNKPNAPQNAQNRRHAWHSKVMIVFTPRMIMWSLAIYPSCFCHTCSPWKWPQELSSKIMGYIERLIPGCFRFYA